MSAFALTDIDTIGAATPPAPAMSQADMAAAIVMWQAAHSAAPIATPAKLPTRYAASAATYAATRATGAAPYRLTDIITVHVANPKRPGTAGCLRYSIWHTGMTVAAYLAALEASPHAAQCRGYGPTDLTYNLKRGLISVAQPGTGG